MLSAGNGLIGLFGVMKIVPGEHRCKETQARLCATSNSWNYFYFRHADYDLTSKCSVPAYGLQYSLGGIITIGGHSLECQGRYITLPVSFSVNIAIFLN